MAYINPEEIPHHDAMLDDPLVRQEELEEEVCDEDARADEWDNFNDE